MAIRRFLITSVLLSVLATASYGGEPSPDEIARIMETSDFNAFLAYVNTQQPGEAEHPMTPEELRAKLDARESGSLELARTALASRQPNMTNAAINGLASYGSQTAREIIREGILRLDPLDPARSALKRAWVSSLIEELQDETASTALPRLRDSTLPALDRALYMTALTRLEDQVTAQLYRPFLNDPAPELRRAALEVNAELWDFEALPALLEMENGTDPVVRRAARELVRGYLIWGPDRPTSQNRKEAGRSFVPYDVGSLRAWRERKSEWEQQQEALIQVE